MRPAAPTPRRGRAAGFLVPGVLLAACGREEARPAEGAPPGGPAWFEVARGCGIDFVHRSGHRQEYYHPEIINGGCALLDADGDGDLDAYLVQGGSLAGEGNPPPNSLYRNRGDGTFEDVTAGSGAGDRGYGAGVATGDFDDDGRIDLFVTNVGRDVLLRNLGDCRFEDVTARAGLEADGWTTSSAFVDYDRDGDLDLYVCHYTGWTPALETPCFNSRAERDYCSPTSYDLPTTDHLYRNRGDGTFEDVSEGAGIGAERGTGLGVACADFDGDGGVDIFVANDAMPNFLWHNEGDGTFVNIALRAGCAVDRDGTLKAGMGVAVEDADEDGDPDILVCNLFEESDSFYRNEGGFFTDRTTNAGLARTARRFTRFGMAWHDFDHDGHFDLFQAGGRVNRVSTSYGDDPYAEPNLLYRGTGDGRFEEVLPRGGTAELLIASSRAAAFGDVNGDGAVDVLVLNRDHEAHLLLNRVGRRESALLLSVLERSGRDAIGAELRIRVGARTILRTVRTAYSIMAANDPRVHVGLGAARGVDEIEVRWADGESERFGPRAGGAVHVLRRGEGEPAGAR
ncbi:MAG: CRTAC1 family protein [Planctomycetota bacterium]